ncbi:S26 family signal peptidase [Embleya sp. NPDC008237]|uniref:S26 family signal peptidase n=1 Tax=Embleya sp. NPDC008237 TaxID=3363978 RepID=UPI0036ECFB9A
MRAYGRVALVVGTVATSAALAGWAVRSRLALVRVTGMSMAPTFVDGERLVVRRTTAVRRGDAIVFRNPVRYGAEDDLRWLVKRVAAVSGDPVPSEVRPAVHAVHGTAVPPGSLVVRGDAVHTQDSRHFGYVPTSTVLGVVLGGRGEQSRRAVWEAGV